MTEASSTTTYSVPLSSATITIIAPAQGTSSNDPQVFPHLRLRVKPHATVTSVLAPPNPRGKGLEDDIKVVPPIGGKVIVAWEIDASGLPLEDEEVGRITEKVEMAVGEWLVLNQNALGVERFDYPQEVISTSPGGQLIFTPKSALPSDTLDAPIIPSGEPVACLTRIDISLKWSFPSATRGRKRRAKEEVLDPETQAAQVAALTFEAIFGEQATSQSSSETQSSQEAASQSEMSQDSQHATQQAQELLLATQKHSPQVQDFDTSDAERFSDEDINSEAEVLVQVGLGMQKVMRLQMIRRFPYVFDGNFVKTRSTLLMPPGLLDALNCFLTQSARHDTPLLGRCRELFEQLQASQFKAIKHQVSSMARLQTYARQPKRNKNDSQQSNPEITQAELEEKREEECVDRIAGYLQKLRLESDKKPAEDRLRDSLASGLAITGLAGWMQIRQGYTKRGAARAPLQEPVDFHEGPSTSPSEEESPSGNPTHIPLSFPLSTTVAFHPQPQMYAAEEPQNIYDELHQPPEDYDDLDELDAEEYYEDDIEESLGDTIEDFLGTPYRVFERSPAFSDSNDHSIDQYHHGNALQLEIHPVSSFVIAPQIAESSFTFQEVESNEDQPDARYHTLYDAAPLDIENGCLKDSGWSFLGNDTNHNLDMAPYTEFDDLNDDDWDDSGMAPQHVHQFQSQDSPFTPCGQNNQDHQPQSYQHCSHTPSSSGAPNSYSETEHILYRSQLDNYPAESLTQNLDNPYLPPREEEQDVLDDLDEFQVADHHTLDDVHQHPISDTLDPDDDSALEDSIPQSDTGIPFDALSIVSPDTLEVSQHRHYSGWEDDEQPSIQHASYQINDLDDDYPHEHIVTQGIEVSTEYTGACDYPYRSDCRSDFAPLAYDPHLDHNDLQITSPPTSQWGVSNSEEVNDLDDLDDLNECDDLDGRDDPNAFADHQLFEPFGYPQSSSQAPIPSDIDETAPVAAPMHMGIFSYDDINDDLDDE